MAEEAVTVKKMAKSSKILVTRPRQIGDWDQVAKV